MMFRLSARSTRICMRLTAPRKQTPAGRRFATYTKAFPRCYAGRAAGLAAAATAFTGMATWWVNQTKTDLHPWPLDNNQPRPRPELPTFSLAQLKEHTSPEAGYWVSFKGAVYDVTTFLEGHPGGPGRLEMAAGNDLEPFWDVYRLHYRGHIVPLMEEKYRIGNLSPEDAEKARDFKFDDPYEDDPPRILDNTPCTHKPYCGEARLDLLTESYFTPNELFYTRNHYPVPNIAEEEYELIVEGNGVKRTVFTLKDLKTKFQQVHVVSTIQCAGNRGEDFHGIGQGPSKAMFMVPHWVGGAISNAKWTGVRIRDLLKYCALDVDGIHAGTVYMKNGTHLLMASYDADESGAEYEASTFIDKVVSPDGDAIIAFKMNDKPLPRDHGFPCRVILPGHAGARQPKWIHRLQIIETPYSVRQCLNFPPNVTFEQDLSEWPPKHLSEDYRAEMVVQEMPVQSLICQPPQNARIGAKGGLDTITIKGVAWSGGGSGIKRVEVSADNGQNFVQSDLFKPVEQKRRCEWGWTQFRKEVALNEDMKKRLQKGEKVNVTLTSKAVDSSFNVQPENPEPYVNARGTAVNHWYRVVVTLDPTLPLGQVVNPLAQAAAEGRFANLPSGGAFRAPFREGGWEIPGKKEKPMEWHKYNLEHSIDWEYYRNITAPPWYSNAKMFTGKSDVQD